MTSASLPKNKSNPVMLKRYEITTQRDVEIPVWKLDVILGSAMLTILESSVAIKVPQATADKISHF